MRLPFINQISIPNRFRRDRVRLLVKKQRSTLERRRLTKQTMECTVQQSSSERVVVVVEGLQIFARQILVALCSLSPSVCLTPPPEKVRKTAASRPPPPRFFLSIDDMSNKTESERDIETRGGIDVINEPASHSIRSIDRETRILK